MISAIEAAEIYARAGWEMQDVSGGVGLRPFMKKYWLYYMGTPDQRNHFSYIKPNIPNTTNMPEMH